MIVENNEKKMLIYVQQPTQKATTSTTTENVKGKSESYFVIFFSFKMENWQIFFISFAERIDDVELKEIAWLDRDDRYNKSDDEKITNMSEKRKFKTNEI